MEGLAEAFTSEAGVVGGQVTADEARRILVTLGLLQPSHPEARASACMLMGSDRRGDDDEAHKIVSF